MKTPAERLAAKCSPDESGCLIWHASKGSSGYGCFFYRGRLRTAHRVAWELFHGRPIPDGLEIDHLCRVPLCVNPLHLEAVTKRENARRRACLITHCPQGHEYTPENTQYQPKGNGWKRSCRECRNERGRLRYYRLKESA